MAAAVVRPGHYGSVPLAMPVMPQLSLIALQLPQVLLEFPSIITEVFSILVNLRRSCALSKVFL